MSRQSYSRRDCPLCGGKTAGNAFARDAHLRSQRHIDALVEDGQHALAARLTQERAKVLANRKRYFEERRARRATV